METSNASKSDQRLGWELIWAGGYIPPRYESFAKPDPNVIGWTITLSPGALILDVGCGAGRHATYLGSRGFRMTGVDISPSGVKMAQAACAERKIAFEGRVSDMTSLPWADMTFDAALSIATIHHHRRANIVSALTEVRRILKPGGLFLVDFPCTDTTVYQQLREQAATGKINEIEPNTFVDERPQPDDSDGFLPHHFCDEADLRDLLGSFEIIQLRADLYQELENGPAKVGKWVASVRKPS